MAFRSLVGVMGGVAGATSSLRGHTMTPTPAPAPPLAYFTQHHRPETLTETKISEKAPVGRPLFSGPPEQKDGPLAQLMRGDQSMCFTCKLSWQKPSLWNPREQQGAQSHPRKAYDCPRPAGPSQFWPGLAAAMSDVSERSGGGEGSACGLISP